MTATATTQRDARWLQTAAPELIPVSHAAEVLGISRKTLAAMVQRGDVPSIGSENSFIPRQALLHTLHLPRLDSSAVEAETPDAVAGVTPA